MMETADNEKAGVVTNAKKGTVQTDAPVSAVRVFSGGRDRDVLLRVDEPLQRPDGKAFPEKRELADGGLLCPVSGSFCPYVQRVENRGFKGVPSDLLTGIKPSFCGARAVTCGLIRRGGS